MPASSPSDDENYDAVALTRFVVWIQRVIFFVLLVLLAGILLTAPTDFRRYTNLIAMALMLALSYRQLQRSPFTAAKTLAIGVWLVASVGVVMFGGSHSAPVLVYPFTIAAAGWILGRRWLVGITAATVALLVAVAVAEMWGVLQPTPRAHPLLVVSEVTAILVVIALLTARSRQALLNSRDRAVALSTALEQQIDEVAARERQLVQLMNNVPAGIASFGADSRLRNCNQRYADLFGSTVFGLLGRSVAQILAGGKHEDLLAQWQLALQGEPQTYRRVNINPATGVQSWIEASLIPERNGREVTGVYGLLVDVTDKVHAEAALQDLNNELEARVSQRSIELAQAMDHLQESRDELVRSQAKAGLAALVASVSHELSSPIGNSVLVASSLADMSRQLHHLVETNHLRKSNLLELNQALQEGSQMLMRNLARAENLLKNFKQVSADQASEQRRAFDLADAVNEVVASLSPSLKSKPHRIQQGIPAGIQMDSLPGPLGQIVINLINNAYLHAFSDDAPGVLDISAVVQGADVHLRIADNGQGMSQTVLLHLFEPFFSTRIGSGGTGLGMSIVESIVRKTLGGSISVRSVVGQGTVFDIALPLVAPTNYTILQ